MKIVLWLCFVLLAGIYICRPTIDPDLWWHITVGRWIIANHEIPATELWNMFALGNPWVAYSWSNEIVFALVDRFWPAHGLLVLQILFATGLSLSLGYCYSRLARDWTLGAILAIYCTVACFSHFTLRPQSLVWILFVWLIYVCQKIAEQGLSPGRGAAVFGLMALWANTHLSTVLGIFLIVLWLFEPPVKNSNGSRTQLIWLKAALLGFAGTLATPYLGREWLIFIRKSSHPFVHNTIAEFGPAILTQYATVFLVLLMFVLGTFLFKAPAAFKVWRVMGLGVFVLGALAVIKFLPFAVILAGALVACGWAVTQGDPARLGNLAEGLLRFKSAFQRIPREGLSFVCLCFMIVMVQRLWLNPLDTTFVPKAALDFILEKNLPHPLLNTFGQGGYVMYRFSDENGNLAHPVPIDGRTNVTPPHVAKAHHQALTGDRNWREYLNLVKPQTILWQANSPFVAILEAEGKWCSVFRDKYVVMVTRDYFDSHRSLFEMESCR